MTTIWHAIGDDASDGSCSTWHEALDWAEKQGESQGWLYRGQCRDWELETRFDRECRRLGITPADRHDIELNLIREFRRQYGRQDREEVLESEAYALSVMRHHGAPTRLLDWTYSPFIALFFALRDAQPSSDTDGSEKLPVVWRMNSRWLRETSPAEQRRTQTPPASNASFEKFFLRSNSRFVATLNAYLQTERLQLQQGALVAQGDVSVTFTENLAKMDGALRETNVSRMRIRLSSSELRRALFSMLRMNLSDAALFPGLDGFCSSLTQRIALLSERERSFLGDTAVVEGIAPSRWNRPTP